MIKYGPENMVYIGGIHFYFISQKWSKIPPPLLNENLPTLVIFIRKEGAKSVPTTMKQVYWTHSKLSDLFFYGSSLVLGALYFLIGWVVSLFPNPQPEKPRVLIQTSPLLDQWHSPWLWDLICPWFNFGVAFMGYYPSLNKTVDSSAYLMAGIITMSQQHHWV